MSSSKWESLVRCPGLYQGDCRCSDPWLTSTPLDSNMARDSFSTFIPLSVENQAKSHIIFDYFDLLSAIAAHGKVNGFGGRKLSRMAAWWAFEHKHMGAGFENGYKSWLRSEHSCHSIWLLEDVLTFQQCRGRHESSLLCISQVIVAIASTSWHFHAAYVSAEASSGDRIPTTNSVPHAVDNPQGCDDC